MRLLYDLGISLYGLLLRIVSPFHAKANLWVQGRKGLLAEIARTVGKDQRYIWFHFASLGEFEQGRSVMEKIREHYAHKKIIVTFFSPSGYQIRKNTPLADHVFYLPIDTAKNAKTFLDLIDVEFAVFTKYEYWYHYFSELNKRSIPLLMISAIFREKQLFFQPYGGFYRSILKKVDWFFTQNMDSVHLLKYIRITRAGLAGDTRFDRVRELPAQHQANTQIEAFIGDADTLVAGSSWSADEELLRSLSEHNPSWKMIIAPHEIHPSRIAQLRKLFPQAIFFSEMVTNDVTQIKKANILIIDQIGLLSSLYYYGRIAYIGGGFGTGIHNTLEAATYGLPVIFGPNYHKFQEAKDLIELGAGFSIANTKELQAVFKELTDPQKRNDAGVIAKQYVQQKAGATDIIMKYLKTEGLLG